MYIYTLKCCDDEDCEVVEFIHQHITYALSDETKYPEISSLVTKYRLTIKQPFVEKKDGTCKFNAPLTPSDETRIVRYEEKIDKTIAKQKNH